MEQLAVLPAPDEAPRCADFTRALEVDPGGSAIRADVLVAVEVPLPWPKPVFDHALLAGVRDAMGRAPVPSRVLAAVPRGPELEVVRYERRDGGARRTVARASADDLAATAMAMVLGEEVDSVTDNSPNAEVWICTQGSHDTCCGSDGTRLAQDLEGRFDDVVVRRVSHTGGHRFAPTALTLPDGRMWGYLDPDGVEAILRRNQPAAGVAERCRGWWGADKGPAQVAERALLAHEDWTWELAPREAAIISDVDGVVTVEVSAGRDGEGRPIARWLARVAVGREVPTIACRAPGGEPVKPGIEYELIDFARA